MTYRALITDLDNTLYDWVTFFAKAFDAMVEELSRVLETDRQSLLSQFKEIHQRYGSTETPWAALELPAAKTKFPNVFSGQLAASLEAAFVAFSNARREHLRLYSGVAETLAILEQKGVVIIGHTEALSVNAFYRVWRLGIANKFRRLYTIEGKTFEHPFPDRPHATPPPGLIRTLPRSERKPNPAVLRDICALEGFRLEECCYIGDSLTRDVAMAKEAGVKAVWARYGTQYDAHHWDLLVAVTHWTPEDVEREAKLKVAHRDVQPEHAIDSFSELLEVLDTAEL
jgi:FMN phosphatase YigB (HAD superfamily)